MVRPVVSILVLIAIGIAIWIWLVRRRSASRQRQTDRLVSQGFSVQRRGIANDPYSKDDISSVAGNCRGYELQLEVAAESHWDPARDFTDYFRYTTISTRLRRRPLDFRINARAWPHRAAVPAYVVGEDSGGVAIGSPAFDDSYLLFCTDVSAVRGWFERDLPARFATDPASAEYVQEFGYVGPGGGVHVHEGVLTLCVEYKRAEDLDLVGLVNYVARLAELFDEAGDRLARVSA